ncbi:hypothetical protein [Pseudomonas sessilinigenes]|uniref:Uncharacterized protein n=1 Tax=Pseudomonas sessilinigenes TaxID=658629 RepID=A0ABX8MKC7_9PSED|nr:hypothetical protein [Pseudomonas sessilinigenes]AZC27358.1 Ankyrin repeat protein [Pseudomonas sessilinigenes]QXH38728.1 hypothetical protein KSS89_20990 [Pseudomonas sessilinigenes]
MRDVRTIDQLFEPQPVSWGLRGDPYLWLAMAAQLAATPWPGSQQQLDAVLAEAFEQLTSRPLDTQGHFFVESFAHGGMSSGGISPSFWRERGLPLLRQRWSEA